MLLQIIWYFIQTKKESPEKAKKGSAKKGNPQKESRAKKAPSPASKKAKGNPDEKKEGDVSSRVPRSAVNPHHKDNSLREFRRLCAGIAELPGMPAPLS